ncbi:MAG: hypothetical protein R3C56_30790 [Pirellulaceae bacterium]
MYGKCAAGETVDFGISRKPRRTDAGLGASRDLYGQQAEVSLAIDEKQVVQSIEVGDWVTLEIEVSSADQLSKIALATHGMDDEAGVRWRRLRCVTAESSFDVPLDFPPGEQQLPPKYCRRYVQPSSKSSSSGTGGCRMGSNRASLTREQAIENVMQRGQPASRSCCGGESAGWADEELGGTAQRAAATVGQPSSE